MSHSHSVRILRSHADKYIEIYDCNSCGWTFDIHTYCSYSSFLSIYPKLSSVPSVFQSYFSVHSMSYLLNFVHLIILYLNTNLFFLALSSSYFFLLSACLALSPHLSLPLSACFLSSLSLCC